MNYKINDVEVSKEQIKELIKNNPEILEDTKVIGRYFFPKMDETYYSFDRNGNIREDKNEGTFYDLQTIGMGVIKTKEEAELVRDKQKAIVACWKWAQENAPFEPDWNNPGENKYRAYYDFSTKEIGCVQNVRLVEQFTLPYFKLQEDCKKFIEANKSNLELLFTK